MNEIDAIQELKERLVRIESLLENITKTEQIEKEAINEKIKVANKRIADLEDALKWFRRTVAGGFITGGIAILVALIKLK